jgi:gas vesicle protein
MPYGRLMLTIIGTLLGALVGAAAALGAQQIAARDASKREKIQRQADMRRELKNEIESFFESAQTIERIAGDRDQFDYAAKSLASHNFWAQYERLALICPAGLANPLNELADLLNVTLWNGAPGDVPVWKHLADAKWRFREAAQREVRWIEPSRGDQLESPLR